MTDSRRLLPAVAIMTCVAFGVMFLSTDTNSESNSSVPTAPSLNVESRQSNSGNRPSNNNDNNNKVLPESSNDDRSRPSETNKPSTDDRSPQSVKGGTLLDNEPPLQSERHQRRRKNAHELFTVFNEQLSIYKSKNLSVGYFPYGGTTLATLRNGDFAVRFPTHDEVTDRDLDIQVFADKEADGLRFRHDVGKIMHARGWHVPVGYAEDDRNYIADEEKRGKYIDDPDYYVYAETKRIEGYDACLRGEIFLTVRDREFPTNTKIHSWETIAKWTKQGMTECKMGPVAVPCPVGIAGMLTKFDNAEYDRSCIFETQCAGCTPMTAPDFEQQMARQRELQEAGFPCLLDLGADYLWKKCNTYFSKYNFSASDLQQLVSVKAHVD